MKRIKIELWSVGLAAAVMALFAGHRVGHDRSNSKHLSKCEIRAEAAAYLDGDARDLRFDARSQRWSASDGETTAWLDAQTGALVELEFAAP